ncbi:hypothetical protein FRB94_008744 [Tulasnella sp. JGI-2019a]|nr:hypothetical protein FRB94_008744 [Tulasnella sp. JGI-2019a]
MKLEEEVDQVDQIIRELSNPTIRNDGVQTWLCLMLYTIRLIDCPYSRPASILELVERRTEVKGAEAGGSNRNWPTRLGRLEVSGYSRMDNPTWLRITSILGEAAVWNPNGGMYQHSTSEDESEDTGDEEDSDVSSVETHAFALQSNQVEAMIRVLERNANSWDFLPNDIQLIHAKVWRDFLA